MPRAPLGPFPPPVTYDHVLPFTPPGRDLYFYRGNFCGVRIPGAPVVPGCNPANPSLVMACLLDNYPRAIQDAFLLQYAQNGYTHLQRSIGHSLYYGGTIESHIALSKRAQTQFGLFADEWFLGGEALKVPDQDATYWRPILDPLIDALLGAGAIDTACVSWQLDQLQQNTPGNATISIIAYVADRLPSSLPVYTHWVNEALAWWKVIGRRPDGSDIGETWTDRFGSREVKDRFSWWLAMAPYLTGGHHQGDVTMARTNPKLYQDKIKDTLNPFTDGRMGQSWRRGFAENFRLDSWECTGQDQFDDRCSELEGDRVGFLNTCTFGDSGGVMSGYGNGARMPDGTAL